MVAPTPVRLFAAATNALTKKRSIPIKPLSARRVVCLKADVKCSRQPKALSPTRFITIHVRFEDAVAYIAVPVLHTLVPSLNPKPEAP